MSIIHEMDSALFSALQAAKEPLEALQFVIVMSIEKRAEYMQTVSATKHVEMRQNGIMSVRYKGAILAVTSDPDLPQVSVFSQRKSKI